MKNAGQGIFACPGCGAKFALNPNVAGRKIACKCGKIFTAPPMPATLPPSDPYDLAEKWPEPVKPQTVMAPSEIRAQPPAKSAEVELYPYRKLISVTTDESEPEFSLWRDRIIPIALLVVAVALRASEIPVDRSLGGGSWAAGMVMLVFQAILTVALMLAGVLLSAKILGVNFGAPDTAILKLCGLAIFAWACAAMILALTRYQIAGFIVTIHLTVIIYSIGFWTLFTLDLQEALLTVAICGLLQDAAALILYLNR